MMARFGVLSQPIKIIGSRGECKSPPNSSHFFEEYLFTGLYGSSGLSCLLFIF